MTNFLATIIKWHEERSPAENQLPSCTVVAFSSSNQLVGFELRPSERLKLTFMVVWFRPLTTGCAKLIPSSILWLKHCPFVRNRIV
jgi:hypothetical protein